MKLDTLRLATSAAVLVCVQSCGQTSDDDAGSGGSAGTDAGVAGASGSTGGASGSSGGSAGTSAGGTAGASGAAGSSGTAGADAGLPVCGKAGVCIPPGTEQCPDGYIVTQMGCASASGELGSCCIPKQNPGG